MADEPKDKSVFITGDKSIRQGGVMSDADKRVMDDAAAGRGQRITLDELKEMAERAQKTKESFDGFAKELFQQEGADEFARVLRGFRVDTGFSWRAIAEFSHDLITKLAGTRAPWEPPFNQLMGMALCEAAAKKLGEEPWD